MAGQTKYACRGRVLRCVAQRVFIRSKRHVWRNTRQGLYKELGPDINRGLDRSVLSEVSEIDVTRQRQCFDKTIKAKPSILGNWGFVYRGPYLWTIPKVDGYPESRFTFKISEFRTNTKGGLRPLCVVPIHLPDIITAMPVWSLLIPVVAGTPYRPHVFVLQPVLYADCIAHTGALAPGIQ
jgi:hypothetical protein